MNDFQKETDSKSKTISISIQGQNFFLACRKEKQDLLIKAGERVNLEMKIAETSVGRGIERIAITAAINLAIQLEQLEQSIAQGKSLPINKVDEMIKTLNLKIQNELANNSN